MDQININDLKGNPKNPRTISKHDYEALVNSIKRFGDLSGIVFNRRTGQLVGGHQRIEAFKRMGGDKSVQITERLESPNSKGTVAVGYVFFENEQYAYREVDWDQGTENAANIAANRIQGQFDLDLLAEITFEISQLENGDELLSLTGQTTDEINRLLDSVGAGSNGGEEDDAPEVDEVNPPVSKLGEIYQLGRHRLMCGDSTDFGQVSDLMDGQVAAMVHTDPPYGVAYSGNQNPATKNASNSGSAMEIKNDKLTGAELQNLFYNSMKNAVDVSEDKAAFYIWYATSKSIETLQGIQKAGLETRAYIFWYKVQSSMSAFMSQYIPNYEPLLYCLKNGSTVNWYGDTNETCVWEQQVKMSDRVHPTEKPVALPTRAIKNSSKRGDIVLDLFAGSGSTLIAADKLDRIAYLMELDPKYCDVIRKRYAKHVNATDWHEATPVINKEAVDVPAPTATE